MQETQVQSLVGELRSPTAGPKIKKPEKVGHSPSPKEFIIGGKTNMTATTLRVIYPRHEPMTTSLAAICVLCGHSSLVAKGVHLT